MTQRKKAPEPAPDDLGVEASSGPRAKDPGDDLVLWAASLKMRTQGLGGEELEDEIRRYVDRLVERNVKLAPAGQREQARELLRGLVEQDPTVRGVIAQIRSAAQRG